MSELKTYEIPFGPIEYPSGKLGVSVVGNWEPSYTDFVNNNEVGAVYLNYADGWTGESLAFLEDLSKVEHLKVIAGKLTGVDSIEKMTSLKKLSLNCSIKEALDFSKLPELESIFLTWWRLADNILDSKKLRHAYFDKLKLKDPNKLEGLANLESLTISNSQIDNLNFLTKLNGLSSLELINCRKLKDFEAISSLLNLKSLTVRGCGNLTSLDFLRTLDNLEILIISDNKSIESLAPVSKLKKLKAISFAGTGTNVLDGDLSFLQMLPKLAMLSFKERKHYSHKLVKKWNWENLNNPDKLLEKK